MTIHSALPPLVERSARHWRARGVKWSRHAYVCASREPFSQLKKGSKSLLSMQVKKTHTHTQDQKERQAGRSGRRHVRPSESEKRAKIVYLSASHPAVKLTFHTSVSDGGGTKEISGHTRREGGEVIYRYNTACKPTTKRRDMIGGDPAIVLVRRLLLTTCH